MLKNSLQLFESHDIGPENIAACKWLIDECNKLNVPLAKVVSDRRSYTVSCEIGRIGQGDEIFLAKITCGRVYIDTRFGAEEGSRESLRFLVCDLPYEADYDLEQALRFTKAEFDKY